MLGWFVWLRSPGGVALAAAAGLVAGLGCFTFVYAQGFSYFSTDPRACVSCHVMRGSYDSWQKASHHAVAACVDCHLPPRFASKMWAKADNGWRHSKAFTLQDFPEPIRITPRNAAILQENCSRCHAEVIAAMVERQGERTRCVRCHARSGHGPRA